MGNSGFGTADILLGYARRRRPPQNTVLNAELGSLPNRNTIFAIISL